MSRILVIRKSDKFSRILVESNFEVENLPLVETKPLENLSDFEERLSELEIYDGIFLTSRHAAQVLADKLLEKNANFSGRVYVLGNRSFETLKDTNLKLIYDATANTAREMLEKIPFSDLKSNRFLFIRGENSLRVVPNFLGNCARVDETVVYKTTKIVVDIEKINEIIKQFEEKKINAACFFSPSAAECFLERFGTEILHQTLIATIGKTTAEFFATRNLTVDFISPKASAKDFAIELINYLRKKLPAENAERRGKKN